MARIYAVTLNALRATMRLLFGDCAVREQFEHQQYRAEYLRVMNRM